MVEALEDRHITDSSARISFEPSPRRVRALFNNVVVADSRHVMLMRDPKYLPVYYFPRKDVRMDLLTPTDHHTHSPSKGEASYWTIAVGDRAAENSAWDYPHPPTDAPDFKDYLAFYWDKMDAWYEEDDEVFVHARDPYHRVDVLRSSRHVRVVVAGETVAETRRPHLLFETSLPTRYYIPKMDVRMDLLERSDTTSRCPYKGVASYWSVRVGKTLLQDMAWSYPSPIPECPKIEDLVCFFNERVGAIVVDGEQVPVA
ncbi:MAG: DUF427 domain-containing protein [Chloroflexota bacterium]